MKRWFAETYGVFLFLVFLGLAYKLGHTNGFYKNLEEEECEKLGGIYHGLECYTGCQEVKP